eukprot:4366549-Pyramimonas_sp.AAC.1
MPDTITRRLIARYSTLDPARQLSREAQSGPRREAERAQERLLNRARSWAAHWLPGRPLNDRLINNQDDWRHWCVT